MTSSNPHPSAASTAFSSNRKNTANRQSLVAVRVAGACWRFKFPNQLPGVSCPITFSPVEPLLLVTCSSPATTTEKYGHSVPSSTNTVPKGTVVKCFRDTASSTYLHTMLCAHVSTHTNNYRPDHPTVLSLSSFSWHRQMPTLSSLAAPALLTSTLGEQACCFNENRPHVNTSLVEECCQLPVLGV